MTTATPDTAAYLAAYRTNRGLQWVSSAACPRALTHRARRHKVPCWCTSPLNDHGGTYVSGDRRAVVWSPYGADPREVDRVRRAAEVDGLMLEVATTQDGRDLVHLAFRLAERVFAPAALYGS